MPPGGAGAVSSVLAVDCVELRALELESVGEAQRCDQFDLGLSRGAADHGEQIRARGGLLHPLRRHERRPGRDR